MKDKLEKLLKDKSINFEFVSKDKLHGTDEMNKVVSNLIFNADGKMICVLKKMIDKVDENKLSKLVGVKEVKLATKEELADLGFEYGEVPPVAINLDFYADNKMADLEYCYGGSGDKPVALKIEVKDMLRINKAIMGDITI